MIKAIETEYKGYKFRSRLEARWAVFFDACGVKWEYEPEGFDLGNRLYYLPDFLLHDVHLRGGSKGYDLWVEVKGQMTEIDATKIVAFANSGTYNEHNYFIKEKPILVVTSIPEGEKFNDLLNSIATLAYSNSIRPNPFNFELIDDDCFGAIPCINEKGEFAIVGDDLSYMRDVDAEATSEAYKKS